LGGPEPGREQAGLRLVLILSHDLFNRKSETVIAMAITSQPQKAGFPLTMALPAGMLPKPSWVKISQIRTISIDRLGARIAALAPEMLDHFDWIALASRAPWYSLYKWYSAHDTPQCLESAAGVS
jgi:mRNA interferase MazF